MSLVCKAMTVLLIVIMTHAMTGAVTSESYQVIEEEEELLTKILPGCNFRLKPSSRWSRLSTPTGKEKGVNIPRQDTHLSCRELLSGKSQREERYHYVYTWWGWIAITHLKLVMTKLTMRQACMFWLITCAFKTVTSAKKNCSLFS